MTHAPPEVILPLLIAVGACKCAVLPQAYLPTSGIDTNLHFPPKNLCGPRTKPPQDTVLLQPHHVYIPCYSNCQGSTLLYFSPETIRRAGREAWEVKVGFFFSVRCVKFYLRYGMFYQIRGDMMAPDLKSHGTGYHKFPAVSW